MASPKLEVLELWCPIIFLMISSGKLNFEQWITESIVSWSSAVRRGWMSRNVGIWPLFRLCSAWLRSMFLTCSLPSHKHKKKSEHICNVPNSCQLVEAHVEMCSLFFLLFEHISETFRYRFGLPLDATKCQFSDWSILFDIDFGSPSLIGSSHLRIFHSFITRCC